MVTVRMLPIIKEVLLRGGYKALVRTGQVDLRLGGRDGR